jgi:demethylmenaquinone methyltransferase/2-methoxy-6-polyprenyl-1,4-benzoquinol methylase
LQRVLCHAAGQAWQISTGADNTMPTATGNAVRSGAAERVAGWYLNRVEARAAADPVLGHAFREVLSLATPVGTLFASRIADRAVLSGAADPIAPTAVSRGRPRGAGVATRRDGPGRLVAQPARVRRGPLHNNAVMDTVLADQLDYYRRRAGEYDVTAYGDVAAARTRIARLVAQMRPSGRVLEIACGTGLWTEALAGLADTVTAIDAAPEALQIAQDRVRSTNVSFEVADVFSWDPDARFDVIFFSAWLSHVPTSRFEHFWHSLGDLLAEEGRVLFIDEHVDEQEKEAYVVGQDEIVERRLNDGSAFRVVKNFVDPDRLEHQLRRLGWDCSIRRDGRDWICGEARPAR